MRLRLLCSCYHVCIGCTFAAVANVVAHRAMQKAAVLLHHSDMAAQAVLGGARDILPVDLNLAAFDIIKPQQQFQ